VWCVHSILLFAFPRLINRGPIEAQKIGKLIFGHLDFRG